jgi:hypothetical protein
MSLATLKRKTNQKYNNSSVGKKQFSIVGTTRNQGWVGQTSLSRNFPSTPMHAVMVVLMGPITKEKISYQEFII